MICVSQPVVLCSKRNIDICMCFSMCRSADLFICILKVNKYIMNLYILNVVILCVSIVNEEEKSCKDRLCYADKYTLMYTVYCTEKEFGNMLQI